MLRCVLLSLVAVACSVSAGVECSTTNTGTTYCTGTDSAGNAVKTESYQTGTGTTYIKRQDSGGTKTSQCHTTGTGTTYCE